MSILKLLSSLPSGGGGLPYPIHEKAFIGTERIVFSAEVRGACEKNCCGRYGKCWMCPPGAGEWTVLRDGFLKYKNAFVYTTCHALEDSFDFEGMQDAGALHAKNDERLAELLLSEGGDFALAGAGSCKLCEKCSYPDAPCRHPDKARRSLEACGIDVVSLASVCGIHYINGADTVTYFSAVFFN